MNCLHKADDIVHGDRNAAYGEPAENHKCTAESFSANMRKKYPWFQAIDAEDVCWFNVCQKISREMNSKTVDGPVDVCGYTANIEIIRSGKTVAEIREERKAIDHPPESSEYVTALAEAARKSLKPVAPPFIRCADCGNVWMDGCAIRCACPPKQSTHSITQVEPGETVRLCEDCREDFCGCAALRIGPFKPSNEASRPTCFCGSSEHNPLDCPTSCLPTSAASPPHGENGEGQG